MRIIKKSTFALLRSYAGFTLLEVILALAIVSTTVVTLYLSINQATATQRKTEELITATRLAQQVMETIKSQKDDASEDFPLEGFSGFSASYSIKEEEYDLAKLSADTGNDKKIDTTTGAIFTLKHYQVVIDYGKGQKYILDFYRGR